MRLQMMSRCIGLRRDHGKTTTDILSFQELIESFLILKRYDESTPAAFEIPSLLFLELLEVSLSVSHFYISLFDRLLGSLLIVDNILQKFSLFGCKCFVQLLKLLIFESIELLFQFLLLVYATSGDSVQVFAVLHLELAQLRHVLLLRNRQRVLEFGDLPLKIQPNLFASLLESHVLLPQQVDLLLELGLGRLIQIAGDGWRST